MSEAPAITLGDLFAEASGETAARPIAGLASDSRKVSPGAAFVAVAGTTADGATYIPQAAAQGAVAIVGEGERPAGLAADIAYLRVADARRALAQAAARLHPRQPEKVVAVTGTSGKTSVADFTRQIFGALGHRAASIGTLGIVTSDGEAYGSLTTPDPISLHRSLDQLAREGVTRLAMEASSHGIDQARLDGVKLTAAAFTNLGHDHLDYHATMEAYRDAKLRLFTSLLPEGASVVVNADGAMADVFAEAARARGLPVLTTGRGGAGLTLLEARRAGFAQELSVLIGASRETVAVRFPLVGDFQIENALVAAGLVMACEPDRAPAEILAKLARLRGVPGRLEIVGEANGALAIVDYSHKPDALEHVLRTLRPFAERKLVCVFGCGGDRDKAKRPIMGRIASERADTVIVTDDNPRSEAPAAIRAAILAAAPGAREIGDRAEAIRKAVAELGTGDVLVVAGKGHETGQIVGERTLPFSDHEVTRAALAEFFA